MSLTSGNSNNCMSWSAIWYRVTPKTGCQYSGQPCGIDMERSVFWYGVYQYPLLTQLFCLSTAPLWCSCWYCHHLVADLYLLSHLVDFFCRAILCNTAVATIMVWALTRSHLFVELMQKVTLPYTILPFDHIPCSYLSNIVPKIWTNIT